MAVTQIAFDIPTAIQVGLNNGTLFRVGGVVRNQAGHIVTHLKEVAVPLADSSEMVGKIVAFAKKNKTAIIIGTVVVASVVGMTTYVNAKDRKNQEVKIPKCVADFDKALMEYINSIRVGSISEEKIDKAMIALEEIRRNQMAGNIIAFSTEDAALLLDMVKDYTIKFAQVNSFDLLDDNFIGEDEICGLQHYLSLQKQIFKKCA